MNLSEQEKIVLNQGVDDDHQYGFRKSEKSHSDVVKINIREQQRMYGGPRKKSNNSLNTIIHDYHDLIMIRSNYKTRISSVNDNHK